MKWNWGKGLLISMLSFMGFILYLVISISTNQKYSHDLVEKDYYAKEIVYQNEIDQENNLKLLSSSLVGKKTPKGWEIVFPEEINNTNSKGKVFLYRPSNQKLDFSFSFILSNSILLIPDKRLLNGRWNIIIGWKTIFI